MTERKSNYELQAESVRELFLQWDQAEMIERFDLRYDEMSLYIEFFRETFAVNRDTGVITKAESGEAAGVNAVMSICDMLCDARDDARLTGEWRMLQALSPHSNFRTDAANHYSATAKRLEPHLAQVERMCETLGERIDGKADIEYRVEAFPFLPMIFRFWCGDEDFDAKADFMFDAGTLSYVHFETAWYIAGHFVELLQGIINAQ